MKKEESLIEVKDNVFKKFLNSIKTFFLNAFKKEKNEASNINSGNTTVIKENQANKGEKENFENNRTTEIEEIDNKVNIDENQILEDMETLNKVVRGEIKSSNLDKETQDRLAKLCRKRRMEIREKIREVDEKIAKIDRMLLEIQKIKKYN